MSNSEYFLGFKHPKVQRLRRLVRKRADRDAEGVFVVEGPKLLAEAVSSGARIEALYIAPRTRIPLVDALVADGTTVHHMANEDLDRIADTIAQAAGISADDLDNAPFTERGGIDGALADLGPEAASLLTALDTELSA